MNTLRGINAVSWSVCGVVGYPSRQVVCCADRTLITLMICCFTLVVVSLVLDVGRMSHRSGVGTYIDIFIVPERNNDPFRPKK